MTEKLFIKNRKGESIAVLVDEAEKQEGLAFVMHGLGSWKERPITEYMAKSFIENNYTVVRFDATNSFGESYGKIEDATTTNYYEDLEDVIAWARAQKWYQEPFVLSGHSLGALCTGLYAEKNPEKIKGWVPVGGAISGKLSLEARPEEGVLWKQEGYRALIGWDPKDPDAVYKLPWSHFEDRLKYDLFQKIDKLNMPVCIIVGERDNSCLPKHQELLYEKLKSSKELHIIKDAPHTIKDEKQLQELSEIVSKWIRNSLML